MTDPKPPRKGPSTDELLKRWEADRKKSLVFLQLAEEYRKQDFVDAAISVLREGLKAHPNSQAAHVQLARCLMAKREHAEAQAELERIHSRHPDNILAGKLLAEVLAERGQRKLALGILKKLVPFAPDDDEVTARIAAMQAEMEPLTIRGPISEDTSEFLTGELDIGRMGGALAPVPPAPEPSPPAASAPRPFSVPSLAAEEGDVASETTAGGATGEMALAGTAVTPAPRPPAPPPPPPVEASADDTGEDVVDLVMDVEDEEPAATITFQARPPVRELPPVPAELLGPVRAAAPAPEDDDFTSLTLAELYESQGAHAEALALYEKLASRRPGDAELRQGIDRCRALLAGKDVASSVVQAVTTPAPAPSRPRWQPVRPSAAPQAAPQARAAEPEPVPARSAAGTSKEGLRTTVRELERWLAAARAVRQ